MPFKYENLEVWQLAIELIGKYYQLLKGFPEHEQYALASQGRRAAVSVALNIAEGSGRSTDKDFGLFINRAMTSLLESDAVLKIALKLGYIRRPDYDSLQPLLEKVYYKLVAFEKTLRKDTRART
jgi:four helix bundle protein